MFQLIYELRKNCCGWTGRDGTGGESKVLQEVLADLKRSLNFCQVHGNNIPDVTPQVSWYTVIMVRVMVLLVIMFKVMVLSLPTF